MKHHILITTAVLSYLLLFSLNCFAQMTGKKRSDRKIVEITKYWCPIKN